MKKTISLIVILSLVLISLSSCGYNKIMRDYLSDSDNYRTVNVILDEIIYQDPRTYETINNFDPSKRFDCVAIYQVSFETIEDVSYFFDFSPDPNVPLEEYRFTFKVISDNNKVLCENGFYDKISIGDSICIRASNWDYMDGSFDYIAQIEYDGTEYLSFEEGLKNIIDMMNKNKSLL